MKEYFTAKELECKCDCGLMNFDRATRVMLNQAREIASIPFIINSASRCTMHNAEVGGSPTSSHLKGLAADIEANDNRSRFLILRGLIIAGFNRIEIGLDYIHADNDITKEPRVCWFHPKVGGNK